MSFFKVTGASVRASEGGRKCGCVQLELAHKNVAAVKTKHTAEIRRK